MKAMDRLDSPTSELRLDARILLELRSTLSMFNVRGCRYQRKRKARLLHRLRA